MLNYLIFKIDTKIDALPVYDITPTTISQHINALSTTSLPTP